MCAARYALSFAPRRSSLWWRFGVRWLGWDAASGAPVEQAALPGVAREAFHALTAAPRAQGFHAALKAPFALRDGATPKGLLEALARFCSARSPFSLPPLAAERLGDFLALVPAGRESRVNDLAADCVREFDAFRAPLPTAERHRYGGTGLSPRQERYLAEWGEPYVLTDFRFHLTLTGSLERAPPQLVAALIAAARDALAELDGTRLRVDAVCLFEQPDPQSPFRLAKRVPFRGGRR
jgi:putative phosphonate metabolism protein